MSQISTVAVITAKPGQGDRVAEILSTLAEATHGEAGCLLYSLQRGLADRDVFVTVERWDSQASLDDHLSSAHIAAALAHAGELLATAPQIIPAQPLDIGDPAKYRY